MIFITGSKYFKINNIASVVPASVMKKADARFICRMFTAYTMAKRFSIIGTIERKKTAIASITFSKIMWQYYHG